MLEMDSILECVVGGVAVGYIDGDVIIVTVGQVDVAAIVPRWCCSTWARGHLVVRIAVDLNPNVAGITHAVVKPFAIHAYPTTSSQPISPYASTIFESRCLDSLHHPVAELARR